MMPGQWIWRSSWRAAQIDVRPGELCYRRCTFWCCAIHRSEIDVLVLCYSQIDVLVLCYSRTNPTPRQPQELSSVDCIAPSSR